MNFKLFISFIIAFSVTLFSFTITAYADTGPKPSITVKVKNAPEGEYYIDLLEYNSGSTQRNSESSAAESQYSRKAVDILQNYSEDNWFARLGGIMDPKYNRCSGDCTVEFSYSVPDEYKIIIVTAGGDYFVSEKHRSLSYNSNVTFDAANVFDGSGSAPAKTIYEEKTGFVINTLKKLIFTLIPTLFIEGFVWICFSLKMKEKHNRLCFLLTNTGTQLMMYVILEFYADTGWWLILIAEAIILAVETAVYEIYAIDENRLKIAGYALTANAASFLFGIPVYVLAAFLIRS